jgi:hypothetical protein
MLQREQDMSLDREPTTDVVGLAAPRTTALLRASDEDRARVMEWLQAHYVAGRLSQLELEERAEQALAAKTLGDLDALLVDLPPLSEPVPPDGARAGRRSRRPAGRRERREQRRLGRRHGFGAHATSYVLVMALLVAIWLLTTPGGHFWPVWPMLGWGIGLASHGLATLSRVVSGQSSVIRDGSPF